MYLVNNVLENQNWAVPLLGKIILASFMSGLRRKHYEGL